MWKICDVREYSVRCAQADQALGQYMLVSSAVDRTDTRRLALLYVYCYDYDLTYDDLNNYLLDSFLAKNLHHHDFARVNPFQTPCALTNILFFVSDLDFELCFFFF